MQVTDTKREIYPPENKQDEEQLKVSQIRNCAKFTEKSQLDVLQYFQKCIRDYRESQEVEMLRKLEQAEKKRNIA